ncbi:MAG: hypothetical protein Q8P20_08195 [bacterium]|nr:hypothetical protein [bacterium]
MVEYKNECELLYEEYKELEKITKREAQMLKPGQPYEVQNINIDDFEKRKILAKKLVKNCKDYFKDKPGEWFDIGRDSVI